MWKKTSLALTISTLVLIVLEANASTSPFREIPSYGSIESVHYIVVALDGSGDFIDIQSAINAATASTRHVIKVKAGIYDLNPNMKYPYNSIVVKNNIIIRGDGKDQTVIRSFPTQQPYGSNIRAITISSQSDINNLIIEHLTVIQNGTPDNMGYGAIDLRGGTNTNITIRNVKITNVTGAAIAIRNFNNVVIEDCVVERAWTGIALNGGSNAQVKGNRIVDVTGNAIFPQAVGMPVTDLVIEDNYMENVGDVGIDVTGAKAYPPHERILVQGNTLKGGHIRVSQSHDVQIRNNTIYDGGYITVDAGQGRPSNVTIENNNITTSYKTAIGFYGAQDSRAINNGVTMEPPKARTVQCGISAGIWGIALIEGNIIINSTNYGINFAGYSLGGRSNITIRGNTILDFGDIGIYDDALHQGSYLIEGNVILDSHDPFVSRYSIRTEDTTNRWTIRNNRVYAGSISFISAPNSNVYNNIYER